MRENSTHESREPICSLNKEAPVVIPQGAMTHVLAFLPEKQLSSIISEADQMLTDEEQQTLDHKIGLFSVGLEVLSENGKKDLSKEYEEELNKVTTERQNTLLKSVGYCLCAIIQSPTNILSPFFSTLAHSISETKSHDAICYRGFCPCCCPYERTQYKKMGKYIKTGLGLKLNIFAPIASTIHLVEHTKEKAKRKKQLESCIKMNKKFQTEPPQPAKMK